MRRISYRSEPRRRRRTTARKKRSSQRREKLYAIVELELFARDALRALRRAGASKEQIAMLCSQVLHQMR